MLSGKEKNKKQISENTLNFHETVAVCNVVQSHNLHQLRKSFLMIFQSGIIFYQSMYGTSPTIDNPIPNCTPSNHDTYQVKQVHSRRTEIEGGGDCQETLRVQNPILASLFLPYKQQYSPSRRPNLYHLSFSPSNN